MKSTLSSSTNTYPRPSRLLLAVLLAVWMLSYVCKGRDSLTWKQCLPIFVKLSEMRGIPKHLIVGIHQVWAKPCRVAESDYLFGYYAKKSFLSPIVHQHLFVLQVGPYRFNRDDFLMFSTASIDDMTRTALIRINSNITLPLRCWILFILQRRGMVSVMRPESEFSDRVSASCLSCFHSFDS